MKKDNHSQADSISYCECYFSFAFLCHILERATHLFSWVSTQTFQFGTFALFKHFKPSLFGIFHPPCPGNIAWLGSTNFVIGGFVSLRLQLSLGFLSGDLYTRTGKPLETRVLEADKRQLKQSGEKREWLRWTIATPSGLTISRPYLRGALKKRFFKYNS